MIKFRNMKIIYYYKISNINIKEIINSVILKIYQRYNKNDKYK